MTWTRLIVIGSIINEGEVPVDSLAANVAQCQGVHGLRLNTSRITIKRVEVEVEHAVGIHVN